MSRCTLPPGPLFPSFFLGGFECATPINGRNVRIDELALTAHDRHAAADYRLLRAHGIRAARDGVRWNLVDRKGALDFASALPLLDAAEAEGICVVWDLFHYGYPDDIEPFDNAFVDRFVSYCRAFAKQLASRGHCEGAGARFYTPVNEISYFAWAGGDAGVFAPYRIGCGVELKRRLVEAAIAGIDAIREVDPLARFVNCDPVVHVVAPADMPWLEKDAQWFNDHAVCEAWDMLAGKLAPELGGSARHLDIVGVNYYGVNQWEHTRPDSVLAEDDPRRMPLSRLLMRLHRRYGAPMLLSETASCDDDRPRWLERTAAECLDAIEEGVELHGICLYPVIGMADWHSLEFRRMGLWDLDEAGNRIPHAPALDVLRALHQRIESPVRVWRRDRARLPVAA